MNRIVPLNITYTGEYSSIGPVDNCDGVLHFRSGVKYTLQVDQALVARGICRAPGKQFYAFIFAMNGENLTAVVQLARCNWLHGVEEWGIPVRQGLCDTRPSKIINFLISEENRSFTVEYILPAKVKLIDEINAGTFDIGQLVNQLEGPMKDDEAFAEILHDYFEVP